MHPIACIRALWMGCREVRPTKLRPPAVPGLPGSSFSFFSWTPKDSGQGVFLSFSLMGFLLQ